MFEVLVVNTRQHGVWRPPTDRPGVTKAMTWPTPRDEERLADDCTHDFARKGPALSIETPGPSHIYVDGVYRKVAVVPVA